MTFSAKMFHWVRPKVVNENVCKIKQGQHPLVKTSVEAFIANDTRLVRIALAA